MMKRSIKIIAAASLVCLALTGCAQQTARAKVDGGSLSMEQFIRDAQSQGMTIERKWQVPVFPAMPCPNRLYGPEVVQ